RLRCALALPRRPLISISTLHCHPPLFSDGAAIHRFLPSLPTRRSSDLVGCDLHHSRLHRHSSPGSSLRRPEPSPSTSQTGVVPRSEEHTCELQSRFDIVCRLRLEEKKLRNCNLVERWRQSATTPPPVLP